MRQGIGCTSHPSHALIIERFYIMKGTVVEKVLLNILYYIFYFPFTLRISFSAELQGEGLLTGISPESVRQNNISAILAYYKNFILVIHYFIRYSPDVCKCQFMSFYSKFGGEIAICKPNIFITGPG